MLTVSVPVVVGFLESVGTSELFLILVVALIVFGPRKLPELSRSLGRGISEFKRASDEFKRTWEHAADLERAQDATAAPAAALGEHLPADAPAEATTHDAPLDATVEQASVAA